MQEALEREHKSLSPDHQIMLATVDKVRVVCTCGCRELQAVSPATPTFQFWDKVHAASAGDETPSSAYHKTTLTEKEANKILLHEMGLHAGAIATVSSTALPAGCGTHALPGRRLHRSPWCSFPHLGQGGNGRASSRRMDPVHRPGGVPCGGVAVWQTTE